MSALSNDAPQVDRAMYSQIVIGETNKESQMHHTLRQLLLDSINHSDVAAALRTIVYERPYRPLRVSTFTVTGDGTELPPLEDHEVTYDTSLEPLFSSLLDALQLGNERSAWMKTLTWKAPEVQPMRTSRFGDERVLIWDERYLKFYGEFALRATILLMMLCPNIEHFVYRVESNHEVERFLRRNNYENFSQQYLRKLRKVTVLPGNKVLSALYQSADPLGLLTHFHRLPFLHSLSLLSVDEDKHPNEYADLACPGVSAIKSLKIENSCLSSRVLAAMIRTAQSLESFSYAEGSLRRSGGGISGFSTTSIGKALLQHKSTLVELSFDCDLRVRDTQEDREDRWDADSRRVQSFLSNEEYQLDKDRSSGPLLLQDLPNTRKYEGTLGSLHDFTSLRRLSVGAKLLLGAGKVVRFDRQKPDGYWIDTDPDASFRLIDRLPQSLEYLQIRGYQKGESVYWDDQINELLLERATRLPNLNTLSGVYELVTRKSERPKPERYDLERPKPAESASFTFTSSVEPEIKEQHPEWDEEQVFEEAQDRWNALPKERVMQLEAESNIDGARWAKQMEAYEAGREFPEVAPNEAEELYKEHLRTGLVIRGWEGLNILRVAVAAGQTVAADIDSIQRKVDADREKSHRARSAYQLRTEGPRFEWIRYDGPVPPADAAVQDGSPAQDSEWVQVDREMTELTSSAEAGTTQEKVNVEIGDEI